MKKKGHSMGMRRGPSLKLKVKTSQRVAVVVSLSVLMMALCIFLYMNFSNPEKSKAANLERVCVAASPLNDLDVKTIIQLPTERQPGSSNQPGVINKRKAVILLPQN